MKFLNFILALLTAILPVAESRADTCQYTFRCQGGICERVAPASCSINVPANNVIVNAPQTPATSFDPPVTGSTSANDAFFHSAQSLNNPTPASPIGPSCAENGSCFGDISNINGMPKTTHVNGYFRRDGTYVRGHYRSSGRR